MGNSNKVIKVLVYGYIPLCSEDIENIIGTPHFFNG